MLMRFRYLLKVQLNIIQGAILKNNSKATAAALIKIIIFDNDESIQNILIYLAFNRIGRMPDKFGEGC